MKYIDEFRNAQMAQGLKNAVAKAAKNGVAYKFMEFCGGHTHAVYRYGIKDLLPDNVQLVHGPGCPVCVLPCSKIAASIFLAQQAKVILCTHADMMRVPGRNGESLFKAKAKGADIRMVYSSLDALAIAAKNPDKKVVFLAIGFETTTPPSAVALKKAEALGLNNFFLYVNHVLTPPAIMALFSSTELRNHAQITGVIGPAHVSTVIGYSAYQNFATHYRCPVVIAGFEPIDVMQAILMLVQQNNKGVSEVENQYTRSVLKDGNLKAKQLVDDVFELQEIFEWRGLGFIPKSSLQIKNKYSKYDAYKNFDIPNYQVDENPGCACGDILKGLKKPSECALFSKLCTPENPIGACMVSSEGACAAHYLYAARRNL